MKRMRALWAISVLVAGLGVCLGFTANEAGHLGITSEALRATQRVVGGEVLTFSDDAIEEIREANRNTDCLPCQTDPSLHVDDEAFRASTTRLLDLKARILGEITAVPPDGHSARRDLGGALHTLQDFYSHSNWVELGHTDIDTRLGRVAFDGLPLGEPTCDDDRCSLEGGGLDTLTSGWFIFPFCLPPPGKCIHGLTILCPCGLNKDDPSRPGFDQARALAITASEDFLNQILDDPSVAGNARAIKALMGTAGTRTLAIVVDDTLTMAAELDQLKAALGQLVAGLVGTDQEPGSYVLTRFNDPEVGEPLVTADASVFLDAVDSLVAHDGGDCPDLAQTALYRTIAVVPSGTTVFLFTDADSKDALAATNAVANAQSKRVRISPLLTGTCSTLDGAYVRDADETGAQGFLIGEGELTSAFHLVRSRTLGDSATLLAAQGTLPPAPQELPVAVDSTVVHVTFAATLDQIDSIVLRRPSGAEVVASDPDVEITELGSGRILSIDGPETGTWRLVLAGSGQYSATAEAVAALSLQSFSFVELTGRSGHDAYYPIAGLPVAGAPGIGLARLFGPFATAEFSLVDQTGATIAPLALVRGDPNAGADEFVGLVELPAQPFRLAVTGVDQTGVEYQRIFPMRFRGASIGVSTAYTVPSLPAGATTTLRFLVHNAGGAGTFPITVLDDHAFVARVDPPSLSLGQGADGLVSVDVAVPPGVADGVPVVLTVVAARQDDATAFNSATSTIPVGALTNRPPDCTVGLGKEVTLWPPDHKLVPIDVLKITGITDPDGDRVAIQVDAITQDEPVDASGDRDGNTRPDAVGLGLGIARIRAERDETGNGRVYRIAYTAGDSKGGLCRGSLLVRVPIRKSTTAIDDGQRFDSTAP